MVRVQHHGVQCQRVLASCGLSSCLYALPLKWESRETSALPDLALCNSQAGMYAIYKLCLTYCGSCACHDRHVVVESLAVVVLWILHFPLMCL
jgi:ribosomal protein S26